MVPAGGGAGGHVAAASPRCFISRGSVASPLLPLPSTLAALSASLRRTLGPPPLHHPALADFTSPSLLRRRFLLHLRESFSLSFPRLGSPLSRRWKVQGGRGGWVEVQGAGEGLVGSSSSQSVLVRPWCGPSLSPRPPLSRERRPSSTSLSSLPTNLLSLALLPEGVRDGEVGGRGSTAGEEN